MLVVFHVYLLSVHLLTLLSGTCRTLATTSGGTPRPHIITAAALQISSTLLAPFPTFAVADSWLCFADATLRPTPLFTSKPLLSTLSYAVASLFLSEQSPRVSVQYISVAILSNALQLQCVSQRSSAAPIAAVPSHVVSPLFIRDSGQSLTPPSHRSSRRTELVRSAACQLLAHPLLRVSSPSESMARPCTALLLRGGSVQLGAKAVRFFAEPMRVLARQRISESLRIATLRFHCSADRSRAVAHPVVSMPLRIASLRCPCHSEQVQCRSSMRLRCLAGMCCSFACPVIAELCQCSSSHITALPWPVSSVLFASWQCRGRSRQVSANAALPLLSQSTAPQSSTLLFRCLS